MLSEMMRTQVARTAAHVVAVLREYRIGVVAKSAEERKQAPPPHPGNLPITQIFECCFAVYECERCGAQRDHLASQARRLRHRAHQTIVLRFPAPIRLRVLQQAAGHEHVSRRVEPRRHLDSRLRLFHEPRVLIGMEQHGLPTQCDHYYGLMYYCFMSKSRPLRNGVQMRIEISETPQTWGVLGVASRRRPAPRLEALA